MKSPITTHVLDTAHGRPAAGLAATLDAHTAGGWHRLGAGRTDADGRIGDLLPEGAALAAGRYRLTFAVGAYFGERPAFYPEVVIHFEIRDPAQHYHVPLLLSPFGYSTYRGS